MSRIRASATPSRAGCRGHTWPVARGDPSGALSSFRSRNAGTLTRYCVWPRRLMIGTTPIPTREASATRRANWLRVYAPLRPRRREGSGTRRRPRGAGRAPCSPSPRSGESCSRSQSSRSAWRARSHWNALIITAGLPATRVPRPRRKRRRRAAPRMPRRARA